MNWVRFFSVILASTILGIVAHQIAGSSPLALAIIIALLAVTVKLVKDAGKLAANIFDALCGFISNLLDGISEGIKEARSEKEGKETKSPVSPSQYADRTDQRN